MQRDSGELFNEDKVYFWANEKVLKIKIHDGCEYTKYYLIVYFKMVTFLL